MQMKTADKETQTAVQSHGGNPSRWDGSEKHLYSFRRAGKQENILPWRSIFS
jgi:hypothetical protein